MKCEEYDSLMAEDRRAGAAAAHAAVCPRCAAEARRSESLAAGLRTLAEETAGAAAPPEMEVRLLREVRRLKTARRNKHHPSRRPLVWAPAVAAGLALAAIWISAPKDRVIPPPEPRPVPAPAAAFSIPKKSDPGNKHATRAKVPVTAKKTDALRTPERSGQTFAQEPFVELPFAPRVSPVESLDVLRVRLPRAAVLRLGLPVASDRIWEPVTADVVFGQDGMARAIRFVK